MPKASTVTEWSITRSAGICGLTISGSLPAFCIAARRALKSFTTGTTGEILHQYARRQKSHRRRVPSSDLGCQFGPGQSNCCCWVVAALALVAQAAFQQDADGEYGSREIQVRLVSFHAQFGQAEEVDRIYPPKNRFCWYFDEDVVCMTFPDYYSFDMVIPRI